MANNKASDCDTFPYEFVKPYGLVWILAYLKSIKKLFTLDLWVS